MKTPDAKSQGETLDIFSGLLKKRIKPKEDILYIPFKNLRTLIQTLLLSLMAGSRKNRYRIIETKT